MYTYTHTHIHAPHTHLLNTGYLLSRVRPGSSLMASRFKIQCRHSSGIGLIPGLRNFHMLQRQRKKKKKSKARSRNKGFVFSGELEAKQKFRNRNIKAQVNKFKNQSK